MPVLSDLSLDDIQDLLGVCAMNKALDSALEGCEENRLKSVNDAERLLLRVADDSRSVFCVNKAILISLERGVGVDFSTFDHCLKRSCEVSVRGVCEEAKNVVLVEAAFRVRPSALLCVRKSRLLAVDTAFELGIPRVDPALRESFELAKMPSFWSLKSSKLSRENCKGLAVDTLGVVLMVVECVAVFVGPQTDQAALLVS